MKNINKGFARKPNICVIGPGIVGYATGKVLSENGFKLGFIGRSEEKINKLRLEGYQAYTFNNFPDHKYDFDLTFITVATPTVDGKIDLKPINYASLFLGKLLSYTKKYHVVVVKSTVPPGTTENMVIKNIEGISGKKAGKDFGVCMNPEYLREKSAVADARKPWLTLIGEYDKKSGDLLESVYLQFTSQIFRTSIKTAEMQKYVHNLYNATKITFFNEMREIGKTIGADTETMFKLTALSCEGMWNPEYGIRDFGPFQGNCLPKDTQAFYRWAFKNNMKADFLKSAIDINNHFIKKLQIHNFRVIGKAL